MTMRPVSLRASWMAIEPTPPAPPTTSSERRSAPAPRFTPIRSNSTSQAVMVVSGRADDGLCVCALLAHPHLDVDGVDGNGLDAHQQVPLTGARHEGLELEEGSLLCYRQTGRIANRRHLGSHGCSPHC